MRTSRAGGTWQLRACGGGVASGDSGFGIRDSGFGIRDSGFGIRESGIGNRESGIGRASAIRSAFAGGRRFGLRAVRC
ncbi:hypothetical protein XarjCFBP7645_02180 [Xanthomonas arboricola]|uniref:Uncharacterized protein n=1 Tax=Xanthomonas arboricola TaxID=56448 RepID=A0A2S7AJC0_9XANT|nr:hypothetical protein XarjCFBP7645_02180 [Xanthomonas arboricola]